MEINHANTFAWMPGTLLTDGRRPAFAGPEDIANQLNSSGGLRHEEIQKMASVVWHVDVAIHRMMAARVTR